MEHSQDQAWHTFTQQVIILSPRETHIHTVQMIMTLRLILTPALPTPLPTVETRSSLKTLVLSTCRRQNILDSSIMVIGPQRRNGGELQDVQSVSSAEQQRSSKDELSELPDESVTNSQNDEEGMAGRSTTSQPSKSPAHKWQLFLPNIYNARVKVPAPATFSLMV